MTKVKPDKEGSDLVSISRSGRSVLLRIYRNLGREAGSINNLLYLLISIHNKQLEVNVGAELEFDATGGSASTLADV